MNWYLAKLVFQIVCGEGNHVAQFDEQLRLISAENKEDACRKAFNIGRQEEDSFLNNQNQPVRWKFIDISELYHLDQLIDGAEIYSRIEEQGNADSYIHSIHQKARNLLFGNTQQLLNLV